MVRPVYRLSSTVPGAGQKRLPIFSLKERQSRALRQVSIQLGN